MSDRHAGRVALVTGAASGIGRATAALLASEGATVVATDVSDDGLAHLRAEHPGIVTIAGDLCDGTFIESLVARAEAVGPVAVLANVAGIMDHFVPASEVSDDLWDLVLAVNLTAPMRLCRAVLPLMVARQHGAIVNVSSAAGLGGSGAGAAYHASKHALNGLTKHIAFVYGNQGIRCSAVCPGGTATGIGASAAPTVQWAFDRQLPALALGERMAEPGQIAEVISWLASNDASHVNGVILPVDGGWKAT
jgi:NAD(P)-dependent dehydrogenase (short-subunit alcohol dehydrogenase family)